MTPEKKYAILELNKDGIEKKNIAEQLRIGTSSVRAWLPSCNAAMLMLVSDELDVVNGAARNFDFSAWNSDSVRVPSSLELFNLDRSSGFVAIALIDSY